jgi:DNA-binding HxlR family transcriptional regulator
MVARTFVSLSCRAYAARECNLTELGLSLEPILMAMNDWGERYRGGNP